MCDINDLQLGAVLAFKACERIKSLRGLDVRGIQITSRNPVITVAYHPRLLQVMGCRVMGIHAQHVDYEGMQDGCLIRFQMPKTDYLRLQTHGGGPHGHAI